MDLPVLLEVVIGLVFVYLLMSVLCSGINELIAQYTSRRGLFLRRGLVNVLGDRWMYLRLVNHPIVSSLYRDEPGKITHPSYIPSNNFALALLDIVRLKAEQLGLHISPNANGQWQVPDLRSAAHRCAEYGYHIGMAIEPLLDSANGSFDRAVRNIETWYDSSMDRVSGWYKRRTQFLLFFIAAAVTVGLNVDTIEIAKALRHDDALRRTVVEAAERRVEEGQPGTGAQRDSAAIRQELQAVVASMQEYERAGLPVGFSCLATPTSTPTAPESGVTTGSTQAADAPKQETWASNVSTARRCLASARSLLSNGDWLTKAIGLLLTALAVTLGAPFWFDLLNRLVNLRSSGRRPVATTATPPNPADE
jgi:hypothetical protein